uniref:Venom peptide n=1 Tax=Comana monomorpha TaxID=1555636 RepID=A0AAU6PAV6_9NEOP
MSKLLIIFVAFTLLLAQFSVVESSRLLQKRQLDSLSGATFGR